jgi:hypothetical protein
MPKDPKYYIAENGKPLGPYDHSFIASLIKSGKIGKSDMVFTPNTNWVVAGFMYEFKYLFDDTRRNSISVAEKPKSNHGERAAAGNETLSQNSILKIDQIDENPFRLLDIPITASKRQIEKAFSNAKAFAKIGKPLVPKSSFGLNPIPEITIENLEEAKSKIDQSESRLKASIFWFWEGSAIDKMAFEALENKDEPRAREIWEKVCMDRPVGKSNFSSARNLSLYELANSGNGDALLKTSLKKSLGLAGSFFSSEHFDSFLDSLPIERKKQKSESDFWAKEFVGQTISSLKHLLSDSGIQLKEFIKYFESFPKAAGDAVKATFTKKEISEIELVVEEARREAEKNPSNALESARILYSKARSNLNSLSEILGEDDIKFKGLCSSVAGQMRQNSCDYFNYSQECSPAFDPGEKCLALIKDALSLYSEGNTGKSLRKDLEFLKSWVDDREERENVKKMEPILKRLKSDLESAQLTGNMSAAENLVKKCLPRIRELRQLMGDDEVAIRFSDAVASVATGICVNQCNNSGQTVAVYSKALEVMEVIGKLKMSHQVQSNYRQNFNILNQNLAVAQQAERSNSSSCYVATMVYGSSNATEVIILKDFRDRKLSRFGLGRIFISLYYKYSPSFVRRTKGIGFLHPPIRFFINVLVKCIS